jgi:myo-inositol-1(or 4)-monophosphatase/deoxyribonuclease-2
MPMAIAHRGDHVSERENTLAAFAAAARAGADMVELDLRVTRGGEIVVLHDATLSRLWGIDRAVADLDPSALREIGSGDVRIPTLSQVLHTIDIALMIDFTGPEVVEGAVRVVREAGAMDRSLFVTGHVPALRRLRALAPEARIGLTWIEAAPPAPSLLRELGAEFWNPTFKLVTPEGVAAMHALGLKVATWTVDEPADMASVTMAGVDAIVSNRIVELRRFLSNT